MYYTTCTIHILIQGSVILAIHKHTFWKETCVNLTCSEKSARELQVHTARAALMSRNNYTIQGLQRVMHVCTTNFLYLSYELRTTLAKKTLRSGRAEHRKPTNTN